MGTVAFNSAIDGSASIVRNGVTVWSGSIPPEGVQYSNDGTSFAIRVGAFTKSWKTAEETVTFNGLAPTVNTPAGIVAQLKSDTFNINKGRWRQLFVTHIAHANPGNGTNTTENNIPGCSFTIPGNTIGPNGRLLIEGIQTWTGTGTHSIRIRIGGVQIFGIAPTTNTSYFFRVQVRNRNNQALQIVASINSGPGAEDRGANATAHLAPAINFAIDQALATTLQHGTVGDTSQIDAFNVSVID